MFHGHCRGDRKHRHQDQNKVESPPQEHRQHARVSLVELTECGVIGALQPVGDRVGCLAVVAVGGQAHEDEQGNEDESHQERAQKSHRDGDGEAEQEELTHSLDE